MTRMAPGGRKGAPVNTIPLSVFLRDRAGHITSRAASSPIVELGLPRIHYESQDTCPTVSCCMDWRAEMRLSALDARSYAPDIAVGAVDFLMLRLGYEPIGEVLALYGERAAAFEELFDDTWLTGDLDENDDFTAGMPISAVLLVLQAAMDPRMPNNQLRPWAVAQIAHTMLPTTAGLVVMSAFAAPAPAGRPPRRLVSTDHVDLDWPRVGCISIPGHPQFVGQVTAYTYLDDARAALDSCREQTFRVSVA